MPTLDVLGILQTLGVQVVREQGDELVALCPGHKARTGHEDAHPSWSINQTTYAHHCFSCGYSGNLSSLYRDMLGEVPEDLEWELTKQSVQSSLQPKQEVVKELDGPVINEWTLKNYAPIPEKLMELRRLKRDALDKYEVRWDKEGKTWVLPIRSSVGTLMGYQFRQKGGFINYPTDLKKSECLFGFPQLADEDIITLVESPLDAVRLYGLGIPALSSFGAHVSAPQALLLARNYRRVVVALDNDAAGHRGAESLLRRFQGQAVVPIKFSYRGLHAKDPGDVEDDDELVAAWNRSVNFNLVRNS